MIIHLLVLLGATVLPAQTTPAGTDQEVLDLVTHAYADSNGVKIHYVSVGRGPLIVFIHGFPDFWYTWRYQMDALSDRFRCVALADESGPIMAIASITMADAAQLKQSNQPISQIAIELYQPLSGGIYLGGRFAPDGVKVSGLQSLEPLTTGR